MSVESPNSLPEFLKVEDLSPIEVRAALDMQLIGPSMISAELWTQVQGFSDDEIFPVARKLSEKISQHNAVD